jgi:Tol biopolymer transport system component
MEQLDPVLYEGPGRGRPADAHADRQRGRPGDLRARRPHHRLQPHLPKFPHLEALQRRPRAAGVHLRLQHAQELKQITNWSGTNTSPMWYGNRIYYLSDQDANRRANIWVYDQDTKQTREVTHFTDYDIDFPALGGDAIAFQQGGKLYRWTCRASSSRRFPQRAGRRSAHAPARRRRQGRDPRHRPGGQVDYALAPNGKRTLFSARGDIFSVPTENGATRNLTSTPGADEDHPAWSPDGRTVAYTTDAGGGQQIAVRPAEGGPEKILTSFAEGYFYGPIFSPDGKTLAFSDGAHRLWIVGTDGGAPKQVAQDKLSEIHDQAFSPDGRWLAFSLSAVGRRRDLVLYEIATDKLTRLGDGGNRFESRLVVRRQVPLFRVEPARESGWIGRRVRFRDREVRGDLRHPAGTRHGLAGRAEVRRGEHPLR